jgi:peptidyl-prolyl cis-trans isomerase SurA
MKRFTFVLAIFLPVLTQARLLEKVVGVVGEDVITLSEIDHTKKSFTGRANIAPLIYEAGKDSTKEILDSKIKIYIIKEKLRELAIIVDDDTVESRINSIEKSQGVTRDFLVSYLQSQGLNFSEYFDLIKNMIEISYFNQRVIAPLISISDQEVETYYRNNIAGKYSTYNYKVVDFVVPEKTFKSLNEAKVIEGLKFYQKNGDFPEFLKGIDSSNLEFSSSNLSTEMNNVLSRTPKNSFSSPVKISDVFHIFYVLKKGKTSNFNFEKNKEQLKMQLSINKSAETLEKWIENERENYYIKYF